MSDSPCTKDCERVAYCTTCGKRKAPAGRDPGVVMSNSYCAHECPGHYKPPHSGHLWPGELDDQEQEP